MRRPALFLALLGWPSLSPATAATQTRIENTATLTARQDGIDAIVRSNTVVIDVAVGKRPTRLGFRLLPLGYALRGFSCDTSGPVRVAHPAEVDAAALAQAPVVTSLDILQPSIMVLENPAGNHDPALRETSYIEVDTGRQTQRIALLETAPDSGVFAGASPAQMPDAAHNDAPDPCFVQIERGDTLTLSFAEDRYSYASTGSILVDPAGFVFDSTTAEAVDGATVSLVGLDGRPARVVGDDGKSAYPSTVVTGADVTDASGRVYPAERGRYHFPLVAPGQYRLTVMPPPGYVAPSSVDAAQIATLRGAAGVPFIINAASYGGSLTLDSLDPFYADIPIDRIGAPALLLTRTLSPRDVTPGDQVEARLLLTNRGQAASGPLHLVDTLPAGLRFRPGSLRGAAPPAVARDGRSIDVALAPIAAGGSTELRFVLTIPPGAAPGEAAAHARASGPLATSNVAAAAVRIRPLLFTDALTIVGQVGEGGCGVAAKGVGGARLLLEDGSVVVTDPGGLFHLESVAAGRHVLALDAAGLPPGLEPIDCARDTTSGGNATSRFVEGVGGLVRRVDFRLRRVAPAATKPAVKAVSDDAVAAGDRDWLAGRGPGIAWLFPGADYNPRAPVTRVAIAHAPGQRVALTIDGKQVDPLSYDATDTDGLVAVSRWVGIPLVPGANRLAARILAEDGHVVATLERVVTVSGPPVAATYDAAHGRLAADGATPPLVAVRVTDAGGRPVRAGTLVSFTVDAPYAAAIDPTRQARGERPSAPVTGDDGIALLPLRPTGQAGAAALHLAFPVGEATRVSDVEAWLTPAATRWTVVGFGAGSIGHDMLSSHLRALGPATRDARIVDGQLAFYAKGRIKGAWLLTLAYDSARRVDRGRGLTGQVDPDRYYTVYGDDALQGHDAASAARLYVRLETRAAYALFGDIETGMGDAQLTRYARTLTGFKTAYRGGRWRASGFAARVGTIAGHDEIQGNGLTGPYRLRARGIVPNTDTLRIEVRDRYRSERIVTTTALARHLDYEIDPAIGTVRFTAPVLSRDAALNPVFIVADYEVEDGGADRLAAGGRVEHRAGALAVGATVIHDETRTAAAGVAGVDARLRLAPGTTLRAEAATGGDRGLGGGGAYVAEVEHHHGQLDLTAYARQQATGFGLGQQSVVEAGTRKLGADLRWGTGAIAITATGWYQAQLAGPGERVAARARVDWHRGARTLFAGADLADDRGLDGGDRTSRLLTLGADQVLAGGAVQLTGQTQFAPGGDRASVDFPVRHQLTAAWRLSPAVRISAGYEIDDGAAYRARTAQLGIELTPWAGARLATSVDAQSSGEAGRRFAQYSIAQSLPLGAQWSLDATLDSATTLAGAIPGGAMVTPFQPVGAAGALGQDAGDFRAATLGAAWHAGPWSARARGEYLRAAADTRIGLSGDLLRRLGEGRTLAASARTYRVANAAGAMAATTIADLALAWRPPASRWALLDRLTLRHDRGDPVASASGGATLGTSPLLGGGQLTTRLIDNAAVDWRSNLDGGRALDVSLYYGIKYVRGRYADESIDGLIDATGVALRQGLGPHWDVGAAASVQHGWSDRRWAWSGGPALGLSPAADLWVTLGYNLAGYRDRDLADDRYTRGGPYLTTRFKFDAADRRPGSAATGDRAMRRWWLSLIALAMPTPLAAAGLTVSKSTSVVADGVSALNPKALPGASVDEAILVVSPATNGVAVIAGVMVVDTIPASVKLPVADLGAAGSGPIEFSDGNLLGLGLLGSGLAYSYASLASTSDRVDFSSDGGVTWTYVPVADAAGCDANVRAIRVRLTGSQAVASGFRLRYRVMIR